MAKAALSIALLLHSVQADWGCLKLDTYTLDDVLAWPDYTFLLKIDDNYRHDEKHDIWKQLCKRAHAVPKFFIAYVPVEEHNDRYNQDVKESFNVTRDDFPLYYLYQGTKKARADGVKYDGPINFRLISRWLREYGVRLPSEDTIDELDLLAEAFMTAPDAAQLEQAKAAAENYASDKNAAVYIKTMERVLEKGTPYARAEFDRVSKILKGGKVAAERKDEMREKLRVLKVFAQPATCESQECPEGLKLIKDAATTAGEDAMTCCEEKCQDTSGRASDEQGHHCDYYETDRTAKQCGDWDDDDFRANQVCCACGGGFTRGYTDEQNEEL